MASFGHGVATPMGSFLTYENSQSTGHVCLAFFQGVTFNDNSSRF